VVSVVSRPRDLPWAQTLSIEVVMLRSTLRISAILAITIVSLAPLDAAACNSTRNTDSATIPKR
jgi:hypothetical protein